MDWLVTIETATGIERGDWGSVILSLAVIIQGLAIIRMNPKRRDTGEYRDLQKTTATPDPVDERKR